MTPPVPTGPEPRSRPANLAIALVGGPFDGDTIRFMPEQRAIIVPESIDGAMHRYEMAADGRAYYASKVAEDRTERLARLLYEFYVESQVDGDASEWDPWDLLDDDERSYARREALWLIERETANA